MSSLAGKRTNTFACSDIAKSNNQTRVHLGHIRFSLHDASPTLQRKGGLATCALTDHPARLAISRLYLPR
eukprot:3759840-Rhodomonas_salina.1